MNHLERLHELLPPPYSDARDSVLSRLLNVISLELEVFDEDVDRMRQTHWIRSAYRLSDARKIAALVGIEPLPWEDLRNFRERLLALVRARLRGALGPAEIREFAFSYVSGTERVTGATFVPGIQTVTVEDAFKEQESRPLFRPLALVENPPRKRISKALEARGGRVPYLLRWEESNSGLAEAVAEFHVTGMLQPRTAVPVLVNLTNGDLIGYAGMLRFGQTLSVNRSTAADAVPRLATATLDGRDVSESIFSVNGFKLGTPFSKSDILPQPLLPRLDRGVNEWIFLSVGLYDVKGLNSFFFAIAEENLREGVFDQTSFDRSLFPSGPVARLELEWTEVEPASFEVHVPRYVVSEPASTDAEPLYERVAEALRLAIGELRAAGVLAEVRFKPFSEVQEHQSRVTLPWVRIDPEKGSPGTRDEVTLGGRFGESTLGGSRFE